MADPVTPLPVPYHSQRPGKGPGQVDFTWVARDINAEFDAEGRWVGPGQGRGAYDPPVRAHEDLDWAEIWPGIPAPAGVPTPIFRRGEECRLDRYLGMCNITCLAMLLEYLGRMRGGPRQVLADLYAPARWSAYKALARGRPYYSAFRLIEGIDVMATIARDLYGVDGAKVVASLGTASQAEFLRRAKAEYLDRRLPLIFACGLYNQVTGVDRAATGGHYALLVGLDDTHAWVHDPWGDASSIERGPGLGYGAALPAGPTRLTRRTLERLIGPNPVVLAIDEPPPGAGPGEATVQAEALDAPSLPDAPQAGRYRLFKLLPGVSVSDWQEIVDTYRQNIGDPAKRRAGVLTQEFGYTQWKHLYRCGYHMGLDFGLAEGTDVCAAHGGVVHEVKVEPRRGDGLGYGTHVVLWDPERRVGSYYGHLKADGVLVEKGARVRPGALLGKSGNTGHSTGPHLHVDVRKTKATTDGSFVMDDADPDPKDDRDFIAYYLNPLGSLVDWYYASAQLAYPFQAGAQVESPLRYFFRAEAAGGGYFPVGLGRTLHGGVHLHPDDAPRDALETLRRDGAAGLLAADGPRTPVRCLAPGYVVAARLEPAAPPAGDAAGGDALRRTLAGHTGFVLVRHEVARTGPGDAPFTPFYSLYMHLAPEALPADGQAWDVEAEYARLGWIKQLLLKRNPAIVRLQPPEATERGLPYEVLYTTAAPEALETAASLQVVGRRQPVAIREATPRGGVTAQVRTAFLKEGPADVAQALRELPRGALLTFSGPLLPVAAGEVLGHVRAEKGRAQGFLHWEVFFAQGDGTLGALLDALGELGVDRGLFETLADDAKADNYLQRAELERLYAAWGGPGADPRVEEQLRALLDAVPADDAGLDAAGLAAFRARLVELVTGHDFAYEVTLELDGAAAVDAAFDAEPVKVEFFGWGADGRPARLDLERTAAVDGVTHDLGRRVRESLQGLTLGALRAGRRILVPLEAARLEVSSRAFHLALTPTGDPAAFFQRIVRQRLRNVVFAHASEWTPASLRALLQTLQARGHLDRGDAASDADVVARHFADLYPLTWWGRPARGQPDLLGRDDALGEVPIVGEAGRERSLFETLLTREARVENLHPVTATWMLQLLLEAEKVRLRSAWGGAGEEGSNPLRDVAWYFPSRSDRTRLTLEPRVGQAGFLVAVGTTAARGDGAPIEATGEGGRALRLGPPAFDADGVSARPIAPCLWGTWRLPEPAAARSNHTLSTITVARPAVRTLAVQLARRTLGEGADRRQADALTVTLGFDADACPDLLEGFVFLRRRRRPAPPPGAGGATAGADAPPAPPWEDVDQALPVRGARGAGAAVTLEADLTGLRAALTPAGPDEALDVQAGFFCPNGGLLAAERATAPEEVGATPVPLRLADLLARVRAPGGGPDLLGEAGPDGVVDAERQWRDVLVAGRPAGEHYTPRTDLHHFGDKDGELDWSQKLGLLRPGVELQKLGEREYPPSPKEFASKVWFRVRTPAGAVAWCYGGLLDRVAGAAAPAPATRYRPTCELHHFGDKAGELDWGARLGLLSPAERFEKVGEREYPPYPQGYASHLWYRIKKADGTLAWCFGGLVTEA